MARLTSKIVLAAPPKLAKRPRPPRPPRPASMPRGPNLYRATRTVEQHGNLWVVPPEGFVGAHTSATEWMVYRALALHLKTPAHPEEPPFVGGLNWQFQAGDAAVSGTGNPRIPGGSVTDFQIDQGGWILGIRLDTEYYHTTRGAAQVAKDFYLKTHLGSVNRVVTIYDVHFVGDETGQAVMQVVAEALKGNERQNPASGSAFWRVRRAGA